MISWSDDYSTISGYWVPCHFYPHLLD